MSIEIIAEVAQGYEGDQTLAKMLARGSMRAGANAVKFQLVFADELATPDYQHYKLFKSLEMPREHWISVVEDIHANQTSLYFDVFGMNSLAEAVELKADGVKIHTSDFYNSDLIRSALDIMPRVFVSLGGVTVEELDEFLSKYNISPSDQVSFVYGFQAEPTPVDSNNLLRIGSLKERFPGYSFSFMDHAEGNSDNALTLALMVLPLGMDSIEKHISLDREIQLEDYVSALTPGQFGLFVNRIRELEKALGSSELDITSSEKEYRYKAAKVVVTNVGLVKHETIKSDQLALKRVDSPSKSTSIYRIEDVVGRVVASDILPNQQITQEMLL